MIDETSCIVLLDYAENYLYVIQDEVQGYHWNKEQCTVHPVVIYFKNEDNNLKHTSLCFLSDDLLHDNCFVHELERQTTEYIRINMPSVKTIEYFSDGCAGQYKNYNNFCHHKNNFGFDTVWSFFATSHGKSPCDGVCGTVKRKIARTSLQLPLNDQIATFEAVWMFCSTSFEEILFYMIRKDERSPIREKLNERYKLGNTVEGTRSLHHFHPLSTTKIQAKYLSVETNYSISHSFL